MGITTHTFHDPEGSKRVGLIVEIPDMGVFQEPETRLILGEG
jgi:hypothetical protein